MKHRAVISVVATLATAMAVQAQEAVFPPATDRAVITPAQAETIANDLRFETFMPSPSAWLKEEVDPIARERRRIRRMQSQLAQQTITGQTAAVPKDKISKRVGQWNMSLGNTSASNWSPYPDRELDARTIRFPLPKNMKPGNKKKVKTN